MEKYTKEQVVTLLGFLLDDQFAYRKQDDTFVFLGEKVNGNPTADAQIAFERKVFQIVHATMEKYSIEEALTDLGYLFHKTFAYLKEDNSFVFLGESVNGNPTAEAQRSFEEKIYNIVNSIEEK